MILCFPDLDTLRLVVTSTVLPADVTLSEADAAVAADGRIFLDTPFKITKKAAGELTKLNVTAVKSMPGEPERVSCWLQVIPTTKDAAPPQLSSQAPVLFELPSAADLPGIVSEMLRLGNDRQSFRWLASADKDADRRVLLRVIGPPYYTLLRAIDHLAAGQGGPIRAYTEQAPRVWVEVGHTHPFAPQIKLSDDQTLLIRGPRHWTYLPEVPFQDVYDLIQFRLPHAPTEWQPTDDATKLTVPLKLVPGNAADAPELWVLRDDAVGQLDQFVKEADERVTQRLRFAVVESPTGEKLVVLRVASTRGTPPAVQFPKATGYKSHTSLANLFIPVGARLHPQLRRDAVRTLLADDLDAVVWLHPTGNGQFTPETVPDSAFHPLEDWVDYVIETAHEPLKEWITSTRFDFDGFVCGDEKQPKPKDPGKGPKERSKGDKDNEPLTTEKDTKRGGGKKGDGDATTAAEFVELVEQKKPNEWIARRTELQNEFLAIDGPLDHPERRRLWPQLAVANAGAGDAGEAALCWANALWGEDTPDPALVAGWARTEFPQTNGVPAEDEFARRLKQPDPPRGEVRQFAAAVYALASAKTPPKWFAAKLPDVQKYIEGNEPKLSVRAAWLVATRLARLSGADVLGLARMRDRLLQRLLDGGLNPELDLPFFLRTAGLNDSERVRLVRDHAAELHKSIRKWAETGSKIGTVPTPADGNPIPVYVDLLFAFGLARMGEFQEAEHMVRSAKEAVEQIPAGQERGRGIVARYLFRLYHHRVQQAAAGQSTVARLPAEIYDELDRMADRSGGKYDTANGYAHNAIVRLLKDSRLLDPLEQHDPYKMYMVASDADLKAMFDRLAGEKNPNRLMTVIRDLYRGAPDRPKRDKGAAETMTERQFLILHECLPISARCGGEFAAELIQLVPAALRQGFSGVPELPAKQAKLLERGLFLAGHFDRRDLVMLLVDAFVAIVTSKPEGQRYELINAVAGSCLHSLRKLGLRDETDTLLRRLMAAVLDRGTISELKARLAAKPDQWLKALHALAAIATGWLTFGWNEQVKQILAEARSEVCSHAPLPQALRLAFARLVTAYIAALGTAPVDLGLHQIKESFRNIDPRRVQNGFSTAEYYSRLHLNIAEAVVLALVSDDFALGTAGRRWLEDDEYLVRRRIHHDMRTHLTGSGL